MECKVLLSALSDATNARVKIILNPIVWSKSEVSLAIKPPIYRLRPLSRPFEPPEISKIYTSASTYLRLITQNTSLQPRVFLKGEARVQMVRAVGDMEMEMG